MPEGGRFMPRDTRAVGRAGVYFPGLNGRGGAERLAVDLALALAEAGWDASVLTDRVVDRAGLGRDLGRDISSLPIVALDPPASQAGRWREAHRLRAARESASRIRALDLDLFVNAKYKSALPGCGRRNVYYCHFPHRLGHDGARGARAAYLGLLGVIERFAVLGGRAGFLETYEEVWANSIYTAGHVRQRWGRKAEVLYPACEQVPPGVRTRTIAVIGRFQAPGPAVPYKAQDVLLRTFATLTELHRDGWRLVMVGGTTPADQGYVDMLRGLARGLPVELLTDATREQVRDVLSTATIYWHAQGYGADAGRHPETQEHFGIGTVEAMSAGAVPLVFDSAGPAEVVSGVAGVERWTSPDALARLTRALASAPSQRLDELGVRCQRRAGDFDLWHFRGRLGELL